MARLAVQVLARPDLGDLPQVHDRDPVGHVPHHGQVMGDEHARQAELVLQPFQQVDDLGLDGGDVQGGDGLVADEYLGAQGQGTRDADPLPLPAGELVRVAGGVPGVQTVCCANTRARWLTCPYPRSSRASVCCI
ncbi:hypothetical protein GCM10010404_62540 [Nonomuraea africana]